MPDLYSAYLSSNYLAVKVQLAGSGSSPSKGRVELAVNGVWGTICDDGFDLDDGHVICRMVGFPAAIAVPGNSAFGNGTGKIWLDNVRCIGNESYILDCESMGLGAFKDCNHGEDAGVICGQITGDKLNSRCCLSFVIFLSVFLFVVVFVVFGWLLSVCQSVCLFVRLFHFTCSALDKMTNQKATR